MNFFRKTPTLKEQQRENERELRKATRTIDRDKNVLEREEKKLELDIKKAAGQGNKELCALLAKQLVQLRKQKTRMVSANSKIQSVNIQNKTLGSNVAVAGAMATTAKTMGNMNRLLNPQQIGRDMQAFKHASAKMDLTDEMISDTLNDVFEESGDEEESQAVLDKVLDEIGIEISGKMASAPAVDRSKVGESSKNADADIEAQLARLRS